MATITENPSSLEGQEQDDVSLLSTTDNSIAHELAEMAVRLNSVLPDDEQHAVVRSID